MPRMNFLSLTSWESKQLHSTLLIYSLEINAYIHRNVFISFINSMSILLCIHIHFDIFHIRYGMPERINEEVFIAMAKALDFIDPGIHNLIYAYFIRHIRYEFYLYSLAKCTCLYRYLSMSTSFSRMNIFYRHSTNAFKEYKYYYFIYGINI